MAFKNAFLKNFKNYLVNNTSAVSYSTGYINEVNNFPSIAILQSKETKAHIGDNNSINSFTFLIRGYIHSSTEASVEDSEQLAYEVELAIRNYNYPNLLNLYVTSVDIDPGLLAPYGLCDMTINAEYSSIC